MDEYIDIYEVAKAKGLKSTRSLRISINKNKYIARKKKSERGGGETYEILLVSLEPEIHERIIQGREKKCELVVVNNQNNKSKFLADKAVLISDAKLDIVKCMLNIRKRYPTKKEADRAFAEAYNKGLLLPERFKLLGTKSIPTLQEWVRIYEKYGTVDALIPKYKYNKSDEFNTTLPEEMQNILLGFLLNPRKLQISKAIEYTKLKLITDGYTDLPCDLTFRRFADFYKNHNKSIWVLARDGEKAFHDNVEEYIERDMSKIEVGEVLVADGHDLNFEVINPFTGKPTRAVLVGFLDWKSGALVGYEIMMTENTQCIASALRNAILNMDSIPKIVYQDNGKAFKAKFFQNVDFNQSEFNGIYSRLGIQPVFAKPYNARAKVIERFFEEFQEGFEKLIISYTGTSIKNKPVWLKRGEKLHKMIHQKLTNNRVPTVQEAIKYINCWIDYYNSKPCPNDKQRSIKECLNDIQKQNIDKNTLDNLMMKSEIRTINKHGITFLGMHYHSDLFLNLNEKVTIKYSLFDLTKIYVYSQKGDFLCIAKQAVKVHPMAYHLGTVKDMEELKQRIKKQEHQFKIAKKNLLKFVPSLPTEFLKIEQEETVIEVAPIVEKPKRERKLTPREQQMNRPIFNSDYEKYEWLMKHGGTCTEDRIWLEKYKQSDEYFNLYGG